MILDKPLFSIITVTFNAEKFIERSVQSVLEQDFENYEYIVIDGGSTDSTLDILNKYSKGISYLASEKDNGIYDAMNKGVAKATGNYLIFLGADDSFYDSSVLANTNKLINNKQWDLLLGNILYNNNIAVSPRFSRLLLLHNSIHHQGTFYSRALFSDFSYSTDQKLVSDYELNLRLFLRRRSIAILRLNFIISLCGEGGVSRTGINKIVSETNIIRSKYLSTGMAAFFKMLFLVKVRLWNAIRHN